MRRSLVLIVLCLTGACRKPLEARLAEGDAAARAEKWDDARARWTEAVETDPQSPIAHARLGVALWQLGRKTDAEASWSKAIALDPADEDSLEGLARLELEAGDAGAAVARLAVVPDSASASLKKLRARALLARGEADGALAQVSTLTGDPEATYLVGSAQIALHRYADAQSTLDGLARAFPASPLGSYGLARLAAAQSRQTDVLLNLAAAKTAAGTSWNAAQVAADPAFAFLSAAPEFKALVGK